eukprot:m.570453 g.570453  ORF g.570453 m.570453 type:complete len:58 (-) comp22263_c3_seq22:3057-3230(-)
MWGCKIEKHHSCNSTAALHHWTHQGLLELQASHERWGWKHYVKRIQASLCEILYDLC